MLLMFRKYHYYFSAMEFSIAWKNEENDAFRDLKRNKKLICCAES